MGLFSRPPAVPILQPAPVVASSYQLNPASSVPPKLQPATNTQAKIPSSVKSTAPTTMPPSPKLTPPPPKLISQPPLPTAAPVPLKLPPQVAPPVPSKGVAPSLVPANV